MTMIAVQTPIHDVKDANSMAAFEAWAGQKGYNLGKMVVNGQFSHYIASDTDDAFLGYCEAARQARAVAYPIIKELLIRQSGQQRTN